MEIQQSPLFAEFTRRLRWNVITVDGTNIFIKSFPFVGAMAKIQRPERLPEVGKLTRILKEHKIRRIVAEATYRQDPREFQEWAGALKQEFSLTTSPFLPTKTIVVDLTPPEADIFASFTSAKRRGVRRAMKHGITTVESHDIGALIRIKNKSAGLFGFITTFGMEKLWPVFAPDHAAILLATTPVRQRTETVGGVLLLFWDNVAYYWIAGATRKGKLLFAPTLLAWECMKLAKQRGATSFDFVGVWDGRLSREFDSWKGFTKFKEGFGGKEIAYPLWYA